MFKQSQLLFAATLLCVIVTSSHADLSLYEVPPILVAKDVLNKDLLESDLYTIENDVTTKGYTNTYRITSNYGDFTAHGKAMLEKRTHEIRAINELEKIMESEKFVKYSNKEVKKPLENSSYDDTDSEDSYLHAVHKRKLAYALNVDVYSSNEALQKYLNSVSWASHTQGFSEDIELHPSSPVRFIKTSGILNTLIRDNPPKELRKINRKILRTLKVKEEVINAFLENTWISPRHQTAIVHSLEYQGLKGGVNDFIQLVSTAKSEEESFFFKNITALIEQYTSNVVETDMAIVVHNNYALLQVRKHFVFPLLVDNGYWSEFGAQLINTFEADLRNKNGADTQIVLWITGEVSARAKKELKTRKIILSEHAYMTHGENL